jgi:hypothetical protein
MPRFYPDSREGSRFAPDDEGLEFPDIDTAEHAAATAAAGIGRDLLPNPEFRDITIEVRNEHRQRVCTVTLTMHIDRVHPSPEAPHSNRDTTFRSASLT